jgi:hypothetical protein
MAHITGDVRMPRPVPPNKNNLIPQEYAQAVDRNPTWARALCFGDSWFQYVPHPTDLNKQLARAFRRTLFLREGLAGRDRQNWRIALPQIGRHIRNYRFDAILLSHGGNDIVGPEMQQILRKAGGAQPDAPWPDADLPDVVRAHVKLKAFSDAMDATFGDIGEVVAHRDAHAPHSVVVAHTYDYAVPNGTPFKLGPLRLGGPWMLPSLAKAEVPVGERDALVRWLVDRFSERLHAFAQAHAPFRVIDSRGTLVASDWENEIHPRPDGFALIAQTHWVPALRDLLR